jgi:hypothetical protein
MKRGRAILKGREGDIRDECRVTLFNRVINARQSVRCCALALEAM